MQLSYSVKGSDLSVAQKYAAKQQGVRGKYTLVVYIVGCMVAPFLVLGLWPPHSVVPGSWLALVRSLSPILVIVAMMFVFLRVLRRQKSTEWETVGNLSRPRTLELQPDYLYSEDATSKSVMSWRAIHNIVDGKEHLFFFLDTRSAIILPKRCFASLQDAENFYQTALGFWGRTRNEPICAPLPDPRAL